MKENIGSKRKKATKYLSEVEKQKFIKDLKKAAANNFTVTDALNEMGATQGQYDWICLKLPLLRSEINSLLRKSVNVQINTIDGIKEIIYRIPEKSQLNRSYTDDEKTRVADIVCNAMMNGISVTSICQSLGIPTPTFYSWTNPESKNSFPYAVRLFEETHNALSYASKLEELTLAKVSLKKQIHGHTLKTVTKHYETRGVDGDKLILRGQTESVKEVNANPTLMQFVLTNHDQNYSKTVGNGLSENYELVDTAQLMDMLKEEKKVDDAFRVDSEIESDK